MPLVTAPLSDAPPASIVIDAADVVLVQINPVTKAVLVTVNGIPRLLVRAQTLKVLSS